VNATERSMLRRTAAAGPRGARRMDRHDRRGEMTAGMLEISKQHSTDRYVVAVSGELDIATAAPVEQALQRAEATDARSVIFDLSRLDFMDASGVALLVRANARSRADSNRLIVMRPPRHVMRVLVLSAIAHTLPFAD
jgi:anti-sigma B factor antagonist